MSLSLEKFTLQLRRQALPPFGAGRCAHFVRTALQTGGAAIPSSAYPPAAKDFGAVLERVGFHEITVKDPDTTIFMNGDVMVMQPCVGGRLEGHVAGFDGKAWISDFIQRDFWAGPDYRKQRPAYVVYRY